MRQNFTVANERTAHLIQYYHSVTSATKALFMDKPFVSEIQWRTEIILEMYMTIFDSLYEYYVTHFLLIAVYLKHTAFRESALLPFPGKLL